MSVAMLFSPLCVYMYSQVSSWELSGHLLEKSCTLVLQHVQCILCNLSFCNSVVFPFGFWVQYDFGYSVPVHLSFLTLYFACSRTANDDGETVLSAVPEIPLQPCQKSYDWDYHTVYACIVHSFLLGFLVSFRIENFIILHETKSFYFSSFHTKKFLLIFLRNNL